MEETQRRVLSVVGGALVAFGLAMGFIPGEVKACGSVFNQICHDTYGMGTQLTLIFVFVIAGAACLIIPQVVKRK